jgi:flagellar FliL protein
MSTAVAEGIDAPPKKRLSKKLVLMLAGALLFVLVAGGGAALWFKHKAAAQAEQAEGDDEGDGADTAAAAEPKSTKPRSPPVFVALEQFTVNLADKEAERFVQIAVSLEIGDAKVGDQIKLYMPAIRNGILMILAHKNSADLLSRAGKERLAREIQAEVALAMGVDASAHGDDAENPVRQVHFSHFIIQ